MGAECALAPAQVLHDGGDRDHRCVAGENRIGAHIGLGLREELALELQILGRRLDHVVGIARSLGEIGAGLDPRDRALVVPEVAQIGGDARLDLIKARGNRVVDRYLMAGEREHLRDAMAHEACAEHTDTRFARH
jgi:hypothetical protein